MIDKKISVSEQVDNLPTEARLIYTWSIPHADDLGMLPYSHKTLKALVVPMWDMRLDTFGNQMEDILKQGLYEVFKHNGEKFYRIVNFLKHQTLKKDRNPNTYLNDITNWSDINKFDFHLEDNGTPSKEKLSKEKRREEKLSKDNIIYMAFKEKINKNSLLTGKAMEKIKSRLKVFTEPQLLKAIENFSKDSWNMEHNSGRGVAWFFHTDERIDGFINLKPRIKQVAVEKIS